MIKRLFCFLTALTIFISVFPLSSNTVSAAENGFEFPTEWFSPSVNADQYRNYYEMLKNNPELSSTYPNGYTALFFKPFGNNIRVYIIDPNTFYTTIDGSETFDYYTGKFSNNSIPITTLDSYTFTTFLELSPSANTFPYDNCAGLYTKGSTTKYFAGASIISNGSVTLIQYNYNVAAVFTSEPVYDPIVAPIYEAVYSLSVDKEEFIKWLIDNGKYVEIVDSLAENRVSGFVDIFQRYGANTKAFAYNVKQFFEFIGIGQTVSDYGAVLDKTRSLYREYQQYVRQQLIDHYNNKVKDTLNIKPVTDDNNTTLITDTDTDTVVIRLLRDILRSLIALPVNIGDLIQTLEVKVNGLENTVNITSDSGLPDFSTLWTYSQVDFDNDINQFSADVAELQAFPVSYVSEINNNPLMPEKMLSDKDSLSVNIPNMSGFVVSDDGKSFSTQTTTYNLNSNQYPWLDPLVKKIKRFASILLIIGYLIHLRYKMPEIIRGE